MNRRVTKALGAAVCTIAMALPMAAASQMAAPRSAWPAETLSGKIMIVDPAQHLLVLMTPTGVPFDIDITGSTAIRADGRKVTLGSLNSDTNRNVTIHFVPERSGDVARTVRVNG